MTKRKLKTKKWNSNSIIYETLRRKKSQTQNQKTRLKAPQRVAEKNFLGPIYDTSISHLDPMIYNCRHVREFSEWSEMETIVLYKM